MFHSTSHHEFWFICSSQPKEIQSKTFSGAISYFKFQLRKINGSLIEHIPFNFSLCNNLKINQSNAK